VNQLRTIVIAVSVAAFGSCLSRTASAQTTYKAAIGQVWPVLFPKGEAKAGSVATTTGLVLNIRMHPSWIWYMEGGLSTPNTVFTPSPRVAFGPAYLVSKTVILGLASAYQYNPSHGNTDWSHTAGASLFLCVPLSKEISAVLSVGGGKSLRDQAPWFFAIQPRMMLTLPW
jgi:hypothetical protein